MVPHASTYQELGSFDFKEQSQYQSLIAISKLELPRKYLTIEKSIGKGSFSEVFIASVRGTHLRMPEDRRIAAKKLKGENRHVHKQI